MSQSASLSGVGVGGSGGSNRSSFSSTDAPADNSRDHHQQHQGHQQHHHTMSSQQQHQQNQQNNNSRIRLTANPHVFSGAVLSPKHAQELTPSLCLAIASALAQQQQQSQQHQQQSHHHHSGSSSSLPHPSNTHHQQNPLSPLVALPHRTRSGSHGGSTGATSGSSSTPVVPYTLWITEAWRVLGWAEPSAALFWEMATMYHSLVLSSRALANEYNHMKDGGVVPPIPPILSCGSTSSIGSGTNSSHINTDNTRDHKKKFTSTASAKELPVWLIGTFLLIHCEEYACHRNLAGQDERRFYDISSSGKSARVNSGGSNKIDFTSLFKNTALSPRTRLHAGWNNDNTHCTAYLLRHLRKILLLAGVSRNPDAIRACMHLAAIPVPTSTASSSGDRIAANNTFIGANSSSRNATNTLSSWSSVAVHGTSKYSANELRRQHDDEHGNVGLNVRLSIDDLENLDFLLQLPSGGGVDDPHLRIGEFLWNSIYQSPSIPPPTATITLADVEREIRQHLEMELLMVGFENEEKDDLSTDEEDSTSANHRHHEKKHARNESYRERAKQQPSNMYLKELSYKHLRGTTIFLKPNPTEAVSSAASASGSVDHHFCPSSASGGRLHDLLISDCSDAHFYLLQPFEHVTIAACTGCTIVVGAVGGLLHVVDCEKTNITSAAQRILISNSCDVIVYAFSPSPPLLVGDNRGCQLGPYNTYYEGLHEDLITTGLAALATPSIASPVPVPPDSPYHGLPSGSSRSNNPEIDSAFASLQKASNKWKQPIELSKLEMPQVPGSPASSGLPGVLVAPGSPGGSSPGADDKAMSKAGSGNDAAMMAPVLVPPTEFHILFVPLENDATRQRRLEAEEASATALKSGENVNNGSSSTGASMMGGGESQYCRLLAEVLQLSPFRLPLEYERRVLMKAERMKNIQLAVQKHLTVEQQHRFEEELNRGFRDWLVTSGNLRQVLDLVHLERKGGVYEN